MVLLLPPTESLSPWGTVALRISGQEECAMTRETAYEMLRALGHSVEAAHRYVCR